MAKNVRLRPVPAVTRAVAVLRLLGRSRAPLTLKVIAESLDLVPSTALHILRALVAEKLLQVEEHTKRYRLGVGLLPLARAVLEHSDFPKMVRPILRGSPRPATPLPRSLPRCRISIISIVVLADNRPGPGAIACRRR